jgi:serine phosphatase RsbU (regulator of sigma subunit)
MYKIFPKILLLSFFFLQFFFCEGQIPQFIIKGESSYTDSLKKQALSNDTLSAIRANNFLGAYYEGISNYKNSLYHLYRSAKLNSGKYTNEEVFCSNYLGYVYWHKSDYKIALYYHHKALSLRNDSTVNKTNIALTYLLLGEDYYDLGDYEKTSEYFFKSLHLSENINDSVGQIISHNRLGKLYYKLRDFPRSKEHAWTAMAINKTIGYTRELAISYNCLGNSYIATGKTDSALFCFKQTFFHFKNCGDVIGQAIASINLGDCYNELYNYHRDPLVLEKAHDYYKMSYMLNEKVNNKFGMIYGLWGVSDIDMIRGETDLALTNYRKALSLAGLIEARSEQYNLCWKIHKVFEKKGIRDSSYVYLKKYVDLKNSMENEEQTKMLLRQESKYEIAKKISEKDEALKKDKLMEEEKQKRKNFVIVGVILITIVLGFAVIVSYKRLRTIRSQNETINSINSTLITQKKEITDSITYARRIQEAILPSEALLKEAFPESFVFYMPKDIVAGDFYWMEQQGENTLIAVGDCTGHGVPGAMVSVICSNALNRAILEFAISDPGKILDKTRELVLEAFSKSDKDVNDGMDISIASINLKSGNVLWAGANNGLWYIASGQFNEIAPHKQSISKTEGPKPFPTHSIQLKKGDTLYMFTDGFADQFGGDKGKKFKYKPLKEVVFKNSDSSMKEQGEALGITFNNWKGNLEQVDDVTIIGIRIG